MVSVKQIGLEGLKEEEIVQLMRKVVDLVKRLSHPSIIKYEGMVQDENTLSIILECVLTLPFYRCAVARTRVVACPRSSSGVGEPCRGQVHQ